MARCGSIPRDSLGKLAIRDGRFCMKDFEWMNEGQSLEEQLRERKAERTAKQRRVDTLLRSVPSSNPSTPAMLKRILKGRDK